MGRKKSKKTEAEFAFGAVETTNSPATPETNPEQAKENYLEILYYQVKQRNGLLGTFDNKGKYKIDDEKIRGCLLNVPKKFDEKVDNVIYASARKNSRIINFKVVFEEGLDFSVATLYLIEIEHGLEEDVKHLTELGKYENIQSPEFREKVFNEWKIWTEQDVFDKDDYLFEYLRLQEEEMLFNKELSEILAQLYLVRVLKILENCGALGQKILQEYKLMIEKLQAKDPGFVLSNSNLKEVLDYVLTKNNALGEIVKSQGVPAVIASYANPLKRIKDKVPVKIREAGSTEESKEKKKEEKKPEKKEEKKSKPKAKSKGKALKPFVLDFGKVFNGIAKSIETKYKPAPKPEKKNDKDDKRTPPKPEKKPEKKPEEINLESGAAADLLKKMKNREKMMDAADSGENIYERTPEAEAMHEGAHSSEGFAKEPKNKSFAGRKKDKDGKDRVL